MNRPASELSAPMVYLSTENTAFLVLGDGSDPVLTWSLSYTFACEQADIHGGVVVAVPIVRDSSWRRPDATTGTRSAPDRVAVPASRFANRDGRPTFPVAAAGAGYPLGRAAAGGGQGSPDGWSAARPDVVGQTATSLPGRAVGQAAVPEAGQLVERVRPFADPAPFELPMDPEAALRDAFGGDDQAVDAFHRAAQADVATLEAVRDGIRDVLS